MKNVGSIDKVVRFIVGLALLSLLFFMKWKFKVFRINRFSSYFNSYS